MDEDHPVCQGIYLKNGIIEKIGNSQEIKKQAELEQAAIIDLNGQTFLPGLHDCHVHMMSTGLAATGINLYDCQSIAAVLEKLTADKSANEQEWIFGQGAGIVVNGALNH